MQKPHHLRVLNYEQKFLANNKKRTPLSLFYRRESSEYRLALFTIETNGEMPFIKVYDSLCWGSVSYVREQFASTVKRKEQRLHPKQTNYVYN